MRKDKPVPCCGYIRDECFNDYVPPVRERKKSTPAAASATANDDKNNTAVKPVDTAAILLALFAYLSNN